MSIVRACLVVFRKIATTPWVTEANRIAPVLGKRIGLYGFARSRAELIDGFHSFSLKSA
ncbi:hypothetical protein ALT785_270109 [Alteromonas infernus]